MTNGARSEYSTEQTRSLEKRLEKLSLSPVRLDATPKLDGKYLGELETLDWAVVDIGEATCEGGLPAFLHGRFLPQMRLLRTDAAHTRSPLETTQLRR